MTPARATWGPQSRALVIESMFTGMNPYGFILARGGIDFDDRAGAERKPHARHFMRKNGLLPRQCYEEAKDMRDAGLASSQPGYVRSDLFCAGFPCQPFSQQARKKFDPTTHRGFECCLLMIDHIIRTRPRVVLLENTTGFLRAACFDGVLQRGVDFLKERLGCFYHIGWATLNLTAWLDVARPRLYLWLIAIDVGSSEDCEAIAEHTRLLESTRPPEYCAMVEDFMFPRGSDEWRTKVLVALQCREGGALSRVPNGATKGEAKAQDHHDPTVAVPMGRLWGLTGTPRQRAMYKALVAARCVDRQCELTDSVAVVGALRNFKWDFSQNLPAKSTTGSSNASALASSQGAQPSDNVESVTTQHKVDVNLLPFVRGPLGCMVRKSVPFSFEHDRVILPEEVLRSHGWQIDGTGPDCTGITEHELQDLVGEMQAVQTCSVVVWSVLVVVAPKLSGVFPAAL